MRLSKLTEDDLSPAQQAVLEQLRQGPRGRDVGMVGPFGVWVRAPGVGGPTQALGAAVRYATSLPENVKEVAICTVGQHHQAKFEFAAHRRLAEMAGVDSAALERLRTGGAPGFTGAEDLAWQVTRQLLGKHRLDASLYAAACDCFGENGLIELVTTIGYYCLVSLTLNTFEIPLQADMTDPFPED